MAYCITDDLVIGDLPVSDHVDKQTFVDDAAEEIDAGIGEFYVVPASLYRAPVDIDPIPAAPFDWRTYTVLKRINAHLATGRLIAMIAIGVEDTAVHAYASSMINWSLGMIDQIKNGSLKLKGVETILGDSAGDTGPVASNQDDYSGVSAFEEFAMKPFGVQRSPWWAPGKASA